jgi:uncharacterized lipoprotein YddW (UPF0748 family)
MPALSFRILLVALLLLPAAAFAQDVSDEAPLYESRGTWLTTVWRLDWPPQSTAVIQEQQLRSIIRNIKNLGMNTVVFQVMSHGEAMYPSERLPWANWLTGIPGRDPGFDPLAVAIEEARSIGIEVHAWMNVYHVAASTSNISPTAEPVHVRFAHPEWVVEYTDGTFWGNPALPGFREWQVGNVMELVRNYDIDAIHFDYMRYPGPAGLSGDAGLMSEYPNAGNTLAQWRRENVNMFVRAAYDSVKAEKPWVKVGSAPIGAYRWFTGAPPGYWAWDDLYQDGYRWLSEGIMDYVAPQLYFTIGTAPIPPNTYLSQDFNHWLRGWMANRNGRHVYTGHATYLETAERRFPTGEIARQIESARSESAHGQVHFRYAHTTGSPFGGQYTSPSLPPPMPWLTAAAAPNAPDDVSIAYDRDTQTLSLSWQHSDASVSDPLRRYAVFKREGSSPNPESAQDLVAVLGSGEDTWTEQYTDVPSAPVEYVVVAQSASGTVSPPSNIVSTQSTSLGVDERPQRAGASLHAPYPNPTSSSSVVVYDLVIGSEISLSVVDLLGRRLMEVASGFHPAGTHRAVIDVSALPSGVYSIDLVTNRLRQSRRLVVIR